jgi:creatinine amidohydrolase
MNDHFLVKIKGIFKTFHGGKPMQQSILLGELTRKELGAAISDGVVKGAIVPTGACEQHHDHLAMIHDTASVTEIAERVATHFYPHVLVTPTVSMSVSEHHMARGGALTIRPEVHLEYVHDVCHSLKRLGVPKVMVLNGHGGNMRRNLEPVAPEQMKKLDELGVTYLTYWHVCPEAFFEAHLESDRSAGHAGEFETSFAMVAFPHRIRSDEVTYDSAQLATIPKGGHILNTVVDGVVDRVRQMLDEG